ncbi:MAG: hypothetical protein WCI50_07885 [Actinomycetes bacterium]
MELEWAGVPAVCIVHRELRDSAAAIARISGHPDYPMVIVDYPWIPTATWTDAEIAPLVEQVLPVIRAALLGRTRP